MRRRLNYSENNYCNLNENIDHQFAMDHALRIYNSDAVYSFIPKNACSTMRLSLAIENGCIDNEEHFEWIHRNNRTFRSDLSGLIKAKYTFVILRCPYARLASVFLDKITGREPAGFKFMNMTDISGGIDRLTFSGFVRQMLNSGVRRGNVHWRPQTDFLVYKQYDDYFCVEEFTKAATRIREKIGMKIVDARVYTAHGLDGLELIDDKNYSNVEAGEIWALKNDGRCPNPRNIYNDELVSIVNEVFSHDISLYKNKFGADNLMF